MAYTQSEIKLLSNCKLCPHNCSVDRFSDKLGFCRSSTGFNISSICIHKGEEPVISGKKGICNIFFSHCNLQCIYCQNHEISNNKVLFNKPEPTFDEIIDKVCNILELTENIVGFVSPSHNVPQMLAIIRGIREAGKNPIFVYNTNGYDTVETLRMLEGVIDVYLPDFKYLDEVMANAYSGIKNYPETATAALKEMVRQKGTSLLLNDEGIAESGIIVRHLVLPHAANQSIETLNYIANEISPDLHISLMSQYYPTKLVENHPTLNCSITNAEYKRVVEAFHKAGFYRGWLQDLDSESVFRPDFSRNQPFEM